MFLISAIVCTYYYCQYFNSDEDEYLGIAGDVIQCANRKHSDYFPTAKIREHVSNDHNDNPEGLPMTIYSLSLNHIIYRDCSEPSGNYELVLPVSGVNRFIMPYNYYNRPWYMWPGSTINIAFHMDRQPSEAWVYLFKGDSAINDFINNIDHFPASQNEVDLLRDASKNIFWKISDNDYYFVAVHINGSEDTKFRANITFNIKYVDRNDYPWVSQSAQLITGINDYQTIYLLGIRNITLCDISPLDASSPPLNSIHIKTAYSVKTEFALLVIILLFVGVLVTGVTSCISCTCFCYHCYVNG